MKFRHMAVLLNLALLFLTAVSWSQESPIIDKDALIDQFLSVDARQREHIRDLVFDAEYIEGKPGDGKSEPEARFIKKIYIKYTGDTALYHEDYLEYYKEGKLQTPGETEKVGKERIEKNKKRKTRNISYPMLRPFTPEHRREYEITYNGIEEIADTTCYHFRVVSRVKDGDHLNGDYYFETDGFHLVRVDFTPAKLVSKAMFKLSKLDMSIVYGPVPEGFWLPVQFEVAGKGKAAFLFGVEFAGTEFYRDPQINIGVPDQVFEGSEDSDDDE